MTGAAPIRSTCPYCGVGCGVLLRPDGAGGLSVAGDPEHPANRGRLCSKGTALGDTLGTRGRLLHPLVEGRRATWDDALDRVASRFSEAVAMHGPGSIAFYVSGQFLTEDYYVANKLMKGFIGSANIDTNSRLCMASTVAGHRRAFGTDTVPGTYDDLEEADLVVIVGSNLAWCHPVLYRRLAEARERRGTRVVVIDPRRTATADIADMHLALRPGTDVALFAGLFAHLHEAGAIDGTFVLDHTEGFDATLDAAATARPGATGLDPDAIEAFYRLWTRTERVVTLFSQGVNQSSRGTDKVSAILNCHLATGRIGRPGSGPFSVTGQPNAMGGREVGGLANTLAAHLDLEDPTHRAAVAGFWDGPRLADRQGLKAVEMFRAAAQGRVKALWIACTNPAATMPEADMVREAIRACDFVVVSDLFATTDTARLADVVLPAAGWGEKDGTVTNSDRTISRQRAALGLPGEARPDWAAFAEVGRRMGWPRAFDYARPAEIFREHAALSGLAAGLGRDFDISGLAGLSDADYDALAPIRWPVATGRSGGRFFGAGGFFTPTGRARIHPVRQEEPAARTSPRYPFRLNTGRVRDHWHTMTRTGRSARLSRHMAEPFLQIHPGDAARLGLVPAGLARVRSPHGEAVLRVLVSEAVQPGHPFAPMHWTDETASAGRIDALVEAATDPVSGQPESKASVVAIERFEAAWYAFAVSSRPVRPSADYWALAQDEAGVRAELAGLVPVTDWPRFAADLFGTTAVPSVFADPARGDLRIAFARNDRLEAALFVAPRPVAVSRGHVAGLLGQEASQVLAARPGAGRGDPGPTVCSCMNVGRTAILSACMAGAVDVAAVGQATGAGVTCGSCRPEIAALLAAVARPEAAE
ncbi:nitrate reductase [Pseudoroseicyclus aestuarii]|uniref:Assimilatory nitrate reductase (NADH) alpha subunit apoprotein n=1 Tax=Pseudoroseicyclus aestuarii TaxID=1795041 RepID=A0A318T6L2_9RHOB|nr:nitrate reductase [Pseudoroseicyclus aestuarii]PYE84028.1 assimilatory nitrate reductase (NADH) alpha subunit apoprotein [Pseudoroseicyclus aestuarii]